MHLFCGYMPVEKFELFDAKMVENGSDLMEPSNSIIYGERNTTKSRIVPQEIDLMMRGGHIRNVLP
jgi:hypothetical protein